VQILDHAKEGTLGLTAFYDLSVSPTGFDFAVFLTLAELARRRIGQRHFRVVFVPAEGTGFWSNENYDDQYKTWRLYHLLVPLTTLFPTCSGITVCGTRDGAEPILRFATLIFPDGYSLENPRSEAYQWFELIAAAACGEQLPGWRIPPTADAFVDQWLAPRARDRRVVTITLREARYHTEQNSNLKAWAGFARSLDTAIFFPVFIRDTERALEPVPEEIRNFEVFEAAAFNVALRAALYLKSFLNLMAATGPMTLAWLNRDCRVLVFKFLNFRDYRGSPTSIRGLGFEPGCQPSFFSPGQRIVWLDDEGQAIKQAFAEAAQIPMHSLQSCDIAHRVAYAASDLLRRAFRPTQLPSDLVRAAVKRNSDVASVESDGLQFEQRQVGFSTARRLRTMGRRNAARKIYEHIRRTLTDEVALIAVNCGLSLIEFVETHNDTGAALTAPSAVDIPEALFQMPKGSLRLKLASVPAEALIEIADWCMLAGRIDRAREVCAVVIALHPNHAEGFVVAGEVDLREGRIAEALTRLHRAAELNSWLASGRYLHGVALLLHGRDSEAKAEFVGAALDDPSHEATRLRISELDPDHQLPPGYSYKDAVSRRSPTTVGVVGEIGFPIELPDRWRNHRIIYYFGKFHAIPEVAARWDFVAPRIQVGGEGVSPVVVPAATTLRELDRILDR
jgi:tetratricopeptide (TPR) repeat protein